MAAAANPPLVEAPDRGSALTHVPLGEADVGLGFSDGTQVQLLRDDPRSHAFRLVAAALIGDREPPPSIPVPDVTDESRPSLVRPITSR